jgi:hypothetical protein
VGANQLYPPNHPPIPQESIRKRICVHSSRCPVFHNSILPSLNRTGYHNPESSRKNKIAILGKEKGRQWRMEIVHPQPFQPAPMLHIKLFGHPNSPPHTHGVLFEPAFERLPWSQWNRIQYHNRRHRICHASSHGYNLQFRPCKAQKAISLWSSHSLRVGACATLYSKGFSKMEIKYLLRWKSNAFMQYLRNLAVTSRRHNLAIKETSKVPKFV